MRVVLCNGVWDPCHYGHLLHLQAARAMGDQLVVSITSDMAVRMERGDGRPVFTQEQREEFLRELRCVDRTVIVCGVMEALEIVQPDVFVKGPDYRQSVTVDVQEWCRRNGTEIRFTDARKWSATALLHELRRR